MVLLQPSIGPYFKTLESTAFKYRSRKPIPIRGSGGQESPFVMVSPRTWHGYTVRVHCNRGSSVTIDSEGIGH